VILPVDEFSSTTAAPPIVSPVDTFLITPLMVAFPLLKFARSPSDKLCFHPVSTVPLNQNHYRQLSFRLHRGINIIIKKGDGRRYKFAPQRDEN